MKITDESGKTLRKIDIDTAQPFVSTEGACLPL